ncbi:uncharacterized protein LOC112507226 [Cynara cardunculus var. scolymus]|uniref:Oxidative stress 3 n=1 Tax=Cynara cardunculus var. scolymus TaxID=59895 RepID=A0A118K7I1_CYNCS|nr:uncharacterized protein LOC112507226 [Cynara cardunculus var. scolymus]KVI12273.1 hypothetical protein Ccrd_009319 [Cynara cardunculus var. scolymus]
MGEVEKRQIGQEMGLKEEDKNGVQWDLMETKDGVCRYDISESDSEDLDESSSSSETIEDASSSSSSLSSYGPLFELSELMAELPIKRGISKFYQGKSESFASLTSVKSIEDLAKKGKYSCRSRRSMKSSYGGGQHQRLSPKATIGKNKKASMFSSLGKMSSLMAN